MASLIPKNGVLINYADTAPSPSKDYCQLYVTTDMVIFRWWKITLRQNDKVSPGELKETHDDYLIDDRIQSDINRVFGKHMVQYVTGLCQGNIDYFPRLPMGLLINIISRLELEDVARLAQCSKQFRDLCHSNDFWEHFYMDHSESPVTDELRTLAEAIGWRKLFFMNKLQLQVQLRRVSKKMEQETFVTQDIESGDD